MLRSSFAAGLNSVREKLGTLPRFLRFMLISGLAVITVFVLAALFIVTFRVQSFQAPAPQAEAPAPQVEAPPPQEQKDPCAGLYNCGR
jgi:hypothetical protein